LSCTKLPFIGFCQEYKFKKSDGTRIEISIQEVITQDSVFRRDTILVSYFDSIGNLLSEIHFREKKVSSFTNFSYDQNNRLIQEIDYEYIPSKGLGNVVWAVDNVDKLGAESGEIWRFRNNVFLDNKKQSYLYGADSVLYSIVNSDFDSLNRLVNKVYNSDPDSNLIVIGEFKAGTTEIDTDAPIDERSTVKIKKCHYLNSMRICEYCSSAKLMSSDTTKYHNGLVESKVIVRTNGERIFESKYFYDSSKLIEYNEYYNGGDPYGGMTDMPEELKILYYYYNKEGYLILEKTYYPSEAFDGFLSTSFHYLKK